MNDEFSLSPKAIEHYEKIREADRLNRIGSQIELIRTQELLNRYLPPSPAIVLDVGGAAGIHAFWLAQQGYHVHLIDPVPHHINQAREFDNQNPTYPLASISRGDARKLEHENDSVEAVLLFGPLYHLTDRSDRLAVLREAHRVLSSGGIVLAVGISRFISTINCLIDGEVNNEIMLSIVEQDLKDGQHRNPADDQRYFTTAFFHLPNELAEEIEEIGFRLDAMIAVEGPARLLQNFKERWQNIEERAWLLKIVRQVEREPNLLGVSTHIMAIAYK
ncbi:MAG: SAM-dependent methyltransferase [Pseudanabaena frigida]|uniref:SAM-dependent methyltransferase n=1 Tax=Pseudanabaena frigida TaxID=945775 RepID=A0A2W4W1J1_9CYAN|nr:MAG: SAM-dependent methyltransferase [Pseudanabaena frigida]